MILGLGLGLQRNPFGSGIALFTGLLDTFPGAAAAYSLRALTRNWVAGDVVEVRRSSDSATQDFTASQILSGALEAFCGVGDGFVSTWYDQSGQANNATQATTTAQPKIVSAGSLILSNGLPSILSDGALTSLDFDSHLSFTADFDNFFVGETSDVSQRTPYGSVNNNDYPRLNETSWRYTIAGNDSTTINYSPSSISLDTQFAFNFNRGSGVVEACIDGVAQTNTAAVVGTHAITKLFQRATNTTQIWDGPMSEIIFYGSNQSSVRSDIQANMNAYYSTY